MSKVSAKANPITPKSASAAEMNLLEKNLRVKQDKRQLPEDESVIISDASPQIGESATTNATTPLVSDTALILAQADTPATPITSASQIVVDTAASVTNALNGNWVMGFAALGSMALVAHHYNTSDSSSGTGTVEGVAIDGYLQNATVYTVNGTTKTRVGTTDSNGKFSIKNPNSDLIQIEGGTNKDTGLANTVVLKAPGTAGGNIVVTPLTTTIAAMMVNDTHLTASQAADKLKTSLGITDNVNLLTLDSIASNNTSVQKANVQIATALSLVTQASEADAVLNDLAATVNNSSVALNLNTALTSSLTSKTTLDTTTLSAISDKLVTLATASNIAALGDVQKAAMANDAPTLADVPTSAQVVTVGHVAALDNFKVADKNGDTLTVTLTATHGTIGGLTDADANTAGIQLTGTASAINSQLAAATFTADTAGSASIGISVTDGQAAAVTGTYAITANAVVIDTPTPTPSNDAPTLTGVPTSAQTVTVGQAAALDNFTVADANGDTLTVTLTATHGTIGSLTDADTNTAGIQLTGTASAINSQLAAATFTADTAGSASIGISVTDGQAAAVTGTYAITANAVVIDTPTPTPSNDAPTLTGVPTSAQTVTVGQAAALDNFTVADANGDTLTVTLTATHGTIGSLTDADTNTAGIQVTGTASAINSQLAAATFTADAAGSASIGISVTDGHAAPVTGSYTLSASSIVSGGIVAGPVLSGNDLVVQLYAANGTTQIGTASVDATGNYTAQIGSYTGVIIAKVSSAGTNVADYLDEATGQQLDLTTVLTAVGVASATGLSLNVNPLTTIAAQVAGLHVDGSGAIDNENAVNSANATVASAFGIQDSLTAPSTLVAVVDVNGDTNTQANDYGKVLATLSGLDQINHGDLQTAIHAFATDLVSNNGQLSAASKFNLVVAAQDADLLQASSGLSSAMGSLLQIDVHDVKEVISTGRASFSDEELASALAVVLNTNVHVADINAVIESITASAGNDLTSLTQAAGRYVSPSFGQMLNALEAEGVVTMTIGGAIAGETVTVHIEDQYQHSWQQDLIVGDGGTLELPQGTLQNIWGEGGTDTATLTLTSANGLSLTKTFGVDFSAPAALTRNALTTENTGILSSYTNGDATITAPNNWNPADHWQYRIGTTGEWHNGDDFIYNENNGSYTVHLQLPDGDYGTTHSDPNGRTTADNPIYLRSYDDAGNETTAVASRWQFTVDVTAPTLSVQQDGHVTISEMGAVILMNDAVLSQAGNDLITAMQLAGQNQYTTSYADVNQPLTLLTAGLAYGSYHYYAMDYAGNITTLQDGSVVSIDSQAPLVNENAGVADQTVYLGQDLNVSIDTAAIFTDPDGNSLSYTATLADGSALPTWLTLNTDDPSNVTLTATAQDVAANVAAGPLTIRLTATDAAGVTVKSVSDDFTLTYVDHILNNAPVVDWHIGSWNVNVGTASDGYTQQYTLDDLASDSDNNPLTYTVTALGGAPLPNWLSIYTDSNGSHYLQAIAAPENVGTYHLTMSVTDGLSDPVSDNFDLVVGDDGSVFYQGQALTSFDLTLSNNVFSGTSTLQDNNSVDLGAAAYQRFYGNTGLSDTAHVILDNAGGFTGTDAPVLNLGNFSTINIDVASDTDLNYLGTWKLLGAENYTSQVINIHTDSALNVNYMDTADYASTVIDITGSANVTINNLDGTYSLHDSTHTYVSSPTMILDAGGLMGNLTVAFNAAAATVTGGQGNDTLTFNTTYGWGDEPSAQISLTGGAGADTFKIGAEATNAHVTVTDFDLTQDALLDLSAVTNAASVMGTSNDVPTLNQQGGFSQNGPSAVDVLGVQNGSDFDIYIDVDHDDTYTSNDVMMTLQNFTLGSASMDTLINHATTIV
jgi:hypothetical protein